MDAVEIVTFGKAQFFRSLERPKPFLLPITDYEVVEVREPRMVLKNVGVDRSVKIGQDKKSQPKVQQRQPEPEVVTEEKQPEDKKRQKRSDRRRRGGKTSDQEPIEVPTTLVSEEEALKAMATPSPSALSALLAPPTTLISETLTRYRRDEAFKQAFYEKEEDEGPVSIPESVPTDEEFDEGDHILFRGHEPVSDFKPFESPEEEQQPFLKEKSHLPPFVDSEDQI